MKLFVLAGEPSGDRLGADLIERLRARVDLELVGVGGPDMIEQGLETMFPMHELSVAGFSEIIPRLPWLYFRAWQVARRIVREKPDVTVLIDAQMFSAEVARRVRRAGVRSPILLYVAPAVWAWAPERAAALKPLFDEVMSVLPFEPQVMRELGGPPTRYVGHPAARRLTFRETLPQRGTLLLLPGSRDGELKRHMSMMGTVAQELANHPKVNRIAIPTLARLEQRVKRETSRWDVPVDVVSGPAQRAEIYATAIAAVSAIGTATLELALAGVPLLATYLVDESQEKRWHKYQIKFASLPNIMLGRELVPEVIFFGQEAEPRLLVDAARRLLDGGGAAQLAGFRELRAMVSNGLPDAPVTDLVDRVLSYRRPTGT